MPVKTSINQMSITQMSIGQSNLYQPNASRPNDYWPNACEILHQPNACRPNGTGQMFLAKRHGAANILKRCRIKEEEKG
jgi:hypothetical protein